MLSFLKNIIEKEYEYHDTLPEGADEINDLEGDILPSNDVDEHNIFEDVDDDDHLDSEDVHLDDDYKFLDDDRFDDVVANQIVVGGHNNDSITNDDVNVDVNSVVLGGDSKKEDIKILVKPGVTNVLISLGIFLDKEIYDQITMLGIQWENMPTSAVQKQNAFLRSLPKNEYISKEDKAKQYAKYLYENKDTRVCVVKLYDPLSVEGYYNIPEFLKQFDNETHITYINLSLKFIFSLITETRHDIPIVDIDAYLFRPLEKYYKRINEKDPNSITLEKKVMLKFFEENKFLFNSETEINNIIDKFFKDADVVYYQPDFGINFSEVVNAP